MLPGEVSPVSDIADAAYATNPANVKWGHVLMNGPVPAWILNAGNRTLTDPPLWPALHHGHVHSDVNPLNEGSMTAAGPFCISVGSRDSPVPDSSR